MVTIAIIAGIIISALAIVFIIWRIFDSIKKDKRRQLNIMKRDALNEALKNTSLENKRTSSNVIMLRSSDSQFLFTEDEIISIGRASDNKIALNDRCVSKYHCLIRSQNGNVVISDRSSQNGTIIKRHGKILNIDEYEKELETGDVVIAGNTMLEYRLLNYSG